MLTVNECLRLHELGYYLGDHVPVGTVGVDMVRRLGTQHEFHVNAARRYQDFFSHSLNETTFAAHGRDLIVDGDWGPASRWQLSQPRCGFPDILPSTDNEEANWPDSCRMELTTSFPHGMTLPGLDTQQIREMCQQALNNVMEDFEIGIRIDMDAHPNTNINFKPHRLGSSVLADQYLAINECSFTSNGRMDSDRTWEYWFAVTVRSHEDGHAYGLRHVRDSSALMYPSINRPSISRRGKMNATDKEQMQQIGYKERTSPPPEGPAKEIRGVIEIPSDWKPGRYQLYGWKE